MKDSKTRLLTLLTQSFAEDQNDLSRHVALFHIQSLAILIEREHTESEYTSLRRMLFQLGKVLPTSLGKENSHGSDQSLNTRIGSEVR